MRGRNSCTTGTVTTGMARAGGRCRAAAAVGAAAAAVAAAVVAAAALPGAAASAPMKTFGSVLSQAPINQSEQTLLAYNLSATGQWGVITHWWLTGGQSTDFAVLSFYVDGETTPSIVVSPGMACGAPYIDVGLVPYSNTYFGKNALQGGWSNNFRLPFTASIVVTYRAGAGQPDDEIYLIVRGTENLATVVGGFTLPPTARMNLAVTAGTFAPLAWVPLVDAPNATGLLFAHTLSFAAGNLNTLEGCYHAYTPYGAPFPGLLLSSGTEDYFDSAYYFNGGLFVGENAGFTHYAPSAAGVTLAAYRIHATDPVFFDGGFQLVWRNGDAMDPVSGLKCVVQTGGHTVGSPTNATVLAYTWYYTW